MSFTPRQEKWRAAAAANQRGFIEAKVRIPDLMGREVRFLYNHDQAKLSDLKKELHRQGKPVRIWDLKFRRAGISLEESAENFAYAYGSTNARVGVIAHLEDRAKELLNNFRVFDDSIKRFDPELVLEKSKDSVFGLKFARSNSQILIATAQNPIKVRGDGLHRLQLTEGAHYYNQFHNVMKEIGPVVPALPGSQIVIESTGSIIGSQPYEHWLEAKQGRNEYTTLFHSWLDNPAMTMEFDNDKHKHETFEKIMQMEPRLAELNKLYGLTPPQIHMAWRLYHYHCENNYLYFCREFPYDEGMAWSAGGDSYFGVYEVAKARPENPIAIYEFDNTRRIFTDPGQLRRVDKVDDYSVLPNLKIWALPKKGVRYLIGADSSYGDSGGDYSSGYLIDQTTREMMASYHGLLRPDEAAHILVSLCRLYNNAMAAPETNPAGGGYEALNCIQRLGYHHIYAWRRRDGNKGIENARAIGWWTNSWSRPLMLGELRKIFIDCVRDRIPDAGMFRDESLIREMRTFGMTPDGTPQANANCKDDRVIAAAIAHQAANDETYMTRDDLLLQYAKSTIPKPPADDELLIKRDPNKVIDNIMNPNSNFNRNRFEI